MGARGGARGAHRRGRQRACAPRGADARRPGADDRLAHRHRARRRTLRRQSRRARRHAVRALPRRRQPQSPRVDLARRLRDRARRAAAIRARFFARDGLRSRLRFRCARRRRSTSRGERPDSTESGAQAAPSGHDMRDRGPTLLFGLPVYHRLRLQRHPPFADVATGAQEPRVAPWGWRSANVIAARAGVGRPHFVPNMRSPASPRPGTM